MCHYNISEKIRGHDSRGVLAMAYDNSDIFNPKPILCLKFSLKRNIML